MMKIGLLSLAWTLMLLSVSPAGAQDSPAPEKKPPAESAAPEKSAGKDASKDAPKEEAEAEDEEEQDPLTKIFGDDGMDLQAGEIHSDLDPETNELKSMHIITGVKIVSELMNVECDDLLIDMANQTMIAKGKIVNFKMNDVEGTCGRLTYDMESKRTLLEGKPKPLIRQKDAKGRITQTSANIITMVQNDKTNNVNWEGNVEFKVIPSPDEKKEKEGEGKKEGPQKIESGSSIKIRPPASDVK